MAETFAPLAPPTNGSRDVVFSALPLKTGPAKAAPTGVAGANGARPNADACGKPTVTLKRTGDVVSGIRVQCGCGQVIDLVCVY